MRPLVYGYFRLCPADPPDVGTRLRRQLAAYAYQEGLTLAEVFTDHDQRDGQLGRAGFVVMVESLRRPGVYGVLIPSLHHFSRFPGVHEAMRALIALETGARVLVMNDSREDRHHTSGRTNDTAGHDPSITPRVSPAQ